MRKNGKFDCDLPIDAINEEELFEDIGEFIYSTEDIYGDLLTEIPLKADKYGIYHIYE